MISRIPNSAINQCCGESLNIAMQISQPVCLKTETQKPPAILESRIRISRWESTQKCQREGHVPQADLEDASLSSSAGHTLFRLGEIKIRDRSHPHNPPRFWFDNISRFKYCCLIPMTAESAETPCCTLLTQCVWHRPFKLNHVVADKGCADIGWHHRISRLSRHDARSSSELLSPWKGALGGLAMLPLAMQSARSRHK